MAATAWSAYDHYSELLIKGDIDVDTDVYKIGLYTSASNAATTSLTALSSITNELANGNGYATGGATVAATASRSGSNTDFDAADPSWTASGGSLVFRYAVCYTGTLPICYTLLDDTPGDITVADGQTYSIVMNSNGLLRLVA